MKYLVLDGAAMDFMDATGLEVMQAVLLKSPRGLRVMLADPSRDLLDILKRGGLLQQLGVPQLQLTTASHDIPHILADAAATPSASK